MPTLQTLTIVIHLRVFFNFPFSPFAAVKFTARPLALIHFYLLQRLFPFTHILFIFPLPLPPNRAQHAYVGRFLLRKRIGFVASICNINDKI